MNNILHSVQAVEAKLLPLACPRGTSGRIQSLRLKRHFQPSRARCYSAVTATTEATATTPIEDELSPVTVPFFRKSLSKKWNVGYTGIFRYIGQQRTDTKDLKHYSEAEFDWHVPLHAIERDVLEDSRMQRLLPSVEEFYIAAESNDPYYALSFATRIRRCGARLVEADPAWLDVPPETFTKFLKLMDPAVLFATRLPLSTELPEIRPDRKKLAFSTNTPVADLYNDSLRVRPGRQNLSPKQMKILNKEQTIGAQAPMHLRPNAQNAGSSETSPFQFLNSFEASSVGKRPVDEPSFFSLHHRHMRIKRLYDTAVVSLVAMRRMGDHTLTLEDYQYLLRSMRYSGAVKVADLIWNYMRKDRIKPDILCYNHYIATKAGADHISWLERNKARAKPSNLAERKNGSKKDSVPGRKSTALYQVGEGGIKQQIKYLFENMTKGWNLQPNEETICWMMIAFAKEGDLHDVEEVLHRVWNISVQKLLALGEEGIGYTLDKSSPLYPSKQMLYTLAFAYGCNHDIPTALRLVDFVSRKYAVEIPSEVWTELLEWTYTMTLQCGDERDVELNDRRLPYTVVANMWDTITKPPYSVKPDMMMYDKIIRILNKMQRFSLINQYMREAQELYLGLIQEYQAVDDEFRILDGLPGVLVPQELKDKRDRLAMEIVVSRSYMKDWTRLTLRRMGHSLRKNETFHTVGIQQWIAEWWPYLHRWIRYHTPTGYVQIKRDDLRLDPHHFTPEMEEHYRASIEQDEDV